MDWRLMALSAVSEGFCPNHKIPLDPDGWCDACGPRGVRYSIRDRTTVVADYAPLG